jgi:methionine-rich copper-binding protein CopC
VWKFGLAVGLGLAAGAAWAHAHLERAQPAEGSKTAEVREIRLAFSEAIEPRVSSITLESGEDRAVVEPAAQVDPADPKVMTVQLYEKLPPGAYTVRWAVVAADGHRMKGSYAFVASR